MKKNFKKYLGTIVLFALMLNVFVGLKTSVKAEEIQDNPTVSSDETTNTETIKEEELENKEETTEQIENTEPSKETKESSTPEDETGPEEEKIGTVYVFHMIGRSQEVETLKGKVGTEYTIEKRDYPGYRYASGETKGVFTEEDHYVGIKYFMEKAQIRTKITIQGEYETVDDIPNEVELILYKNGKELERFTVSIDKNNYYTSFFSGKEFPLFEENGRFIKYSLGIEGFPKEWITNIDLKGYSENLDWWITAEYSLDKKDIMLSVSSDELELPERIVHLYRNGVEVEGSPVKFTRVVESHIFKDMPRFDENGDLYNYTAEQENIKGIFTIEYQDLFNSYIRINVGSGLSPDIVGNIVWKGGSEKKPEVKLKLIQKVVGNYLGSVASDILPELDKVVKGEVVLGNGETSYTWENLPYLTSQFEELGYEVELAEVPKGYTAEYSEDGLTVILTHDGSVEEETVNIEGDIFWKDEDNKNGKRPESVTVNLMANGKKVASETVTTPDKQEIEVEKTPETEEVKTRMFTPKASSEPKTVTNTWSYSFKDMPKEENGETIVYTISQNPVANYKTSFEGSNIINTYTEETTPETEETEVVIGGESSTKPSSQTKDKTDKTDKKALPKTGQVALTGITLAGTALVALGGYTVFKKKK